MHHDNNHLDPVYLVIDSLSLSSIGIKNSYSTVRTGPSFQTTHWLLFIFLPLTRVILRVLGRASDIDILLCFDRWPVGCGSNSVSYLTSRQAGSWVQTQYIHSPCLLTNHRRYRLRPIINMYAADWYFFLGTNNRFPVYCWAASPRERSGIIIN